MGDRSLLTRVLCRLFGHRWLVHESEREGWLVRHCERETCGASEIKDPYSAEGWHRPTAKEMGWN